MRGCQPCVLMIFTIKDFTEQLSLKLTDQFVVLTPTTRLQHNHKWWEGIGGRDQKLTFFVTTHSRRSDKLQNML